MPAFLIRYSQSTVQDFDIEIFFSLKKNILRSTIDLSLPEAVTAYAAYIIPRPTSYTPTNFPSSSPSLFLFFISYTYQGLHTLVAEFFVLKNRLIYKFRMFRPRANKVLVLIPTISFKKDAYFAPVRRLGSLIAYISFSD